MPNLIAKATLVGAGVLVGGAGGAMAVSAAANSTPTVSISTQPSSSTTTTSTTPAHHRAGGRLARRLRHFLGLTAIGVVVSDSATGGVFNQGQLTIRMPDGKTVTASLDGLSHARRYQGHGVKPLPESATSIPAGSIVVVHGQRIDTTQYLARFILETGFAGSPAAGG